MVRLPRMVIAAPASGHGKTTVATGLMLALRRTGLEVAGFKVGPDYIDPGYHALATARPGRNLDAFLCGAQLITPLLLHGATRPRPADLAIIEGAMGLFDGRIGGEGFASSAHIATLTDSPVVLVVDVSHATRTIAAVVHGCATFDPTVTIAGVILNKVASPRHAAEVRSGLSRLDIPVVGELPRDAGISVPSRHLGLVPAAEQGDADQAMNRLAVQIADHVDLAAVLRVAATAPEPDGDPWDPNQVVTTPSSIPPCIPSDISPDIPLDHAGPHQRWTPPVVAIAGGRAFTFRYAETEELLSAAGCEPVVFDPLLDPTLPPGTAGIYLGGGFPEMHATALGANVGMLDAIRGAIAAGTPTVAECAGLLYLCRAVDDHPMLGTLPVTAAMRPRLEVGYREAQATGDTLLGRSGAVVRGHEFHRTATSSTGAAEPDHTSDTVMTPAWYWDGHPDGFSLDPAGTGRPTLHASYLHVHWAGHPEVAQRFVSAVHEFAHAKRSPRNDVAAVTRSSHAS